MLYFAYTAVIDPSRMSEVAPGAEFQFIAHLPEWGLEFPITDREWGGGLPSVTPSTGHTVWGAVFEIAREDMKALDKVEGDEKRAATTIEAMDRSGKRHQVVTHVHSGNGSRAYSPSSAYLTRMLDGSRHWALPAGWIAGLQEHLERSC